ncbi:MAG: DUF1848 domain-containing protein [Lachnospiraceae bacterium]|nr:DUF1848 domain-containing protein [Lachnospiraceae bacterium]
MIINTGSRTDIPAFFSDWFYNRIKEGFVLTRNPYYPNQVLKYKINPDVVDCIVFCTKNPQPMLDRIEEISRFNQFWFVTITPYEKDIEPFVPDKNIVMDTFKQLSDIVGIKAISLRYDPIFITEKYNLEFHITEFEKMCRNLNGYTDNCVISFIDLYAKTKRNFPSVREVNINEREIIEKKFSEIGRKYGIIIRTCCEGAEAEKYGIDISGCMTKEIIERAVGATLKVPKSRKSARSDCNCLLGNDIGMYNTCGHGCIYCYANYDRNIVVKNMKLHNPKSPFIIGTWEEGDNIKDAVQASYYDGQMRLNI